MIQVQKGKLLQVLENGKRAKVSTFQGDVIDNILILHTYGESSFPKVDDNSQILLFSSLGSKSVMFGVPYNIQLQPVLEEGEKAIGNFSIGNKVTFKANGDMVIEGTNDFLAASLQNMNITAATKITLSAPDISLGDAVGLVLNDASTMQVVVTGGSSAGTYPVDIIAAGQTKVSA